MNILKPQEIFLKNLTEASFIDEISKNAEKDVFSKISFTDETVANVKLFDITFEYCKFTNINIGFAFLLKHSIFKYNVVLIKHILLVIIHLFLLCKII